MYMYVFLLTCPFQMEQKGKLSLDLQRKLVPIRIDNSLGRLAVHVMARVISLAIGPCAFVLN